MPIPSALLASDLPRIPAPGSFSVAEGVLFVVLGLVAVALIILYTLAPLMLYGIYSRLGENNRLLQELYRAAMVPRTITTAPPSAAQQNSEPEIEPPKFTFMA
jgi:hypothetical protein